MVLFVLGIVVPGSSSQALRVINEGLETLQGEAVRAPGRLGKSLSRRFGKSGKATNKSARAGRNTRSNLPF